jgi:eukaryotic-like serine/threonine-protein kinase
MTTFQPGDTLGRYRIERPLGHGAMGEVYLARDPQIDRPLAVKTLRLVGVRDEEVAERKERLLREARTAGRLIHPHIVTLFDAGEQEGVLFLAFEYVPGEDLSHRLRRGPLPVGEALRLAREACEGLGHAHRAGIVHRDVKPSNLMLDADGRVKISDFGIAKMAGQGTELTISGAVMGSPHYLSPEQVRGEELDGRSDLFSLGIVLYEMLTGRRPFEGETISTLVFQILGTEPPPLPALRPGLAPRLPALLGRMLAKDRAQRVSDAQAAVEEIAALERALSEELLGQAATATAAPTDATVAMDSGSLAAQAAGEGGEAPAPAPPPGQEEAVWPVDASGPAAGAAGGVTAAGSSGEADRSARGGGGAASGGPGAAPPARGGAAAGGPALGAGPAGTAGAGSAPPGALVPPPPPGAAAASGAAAAPGSGPSIGGPPHGPLPLPPGARGASPSASMPPPGAASLANAPGAGSGGTYAVPALPARRRGLWAAVAAAMLLVAIVAGFLLWSGGGAPEDAERVAEAMRGEDGELLPPGEAAGGIAAGEAEGARGADGATSQPPVRRPAAGGDRPATGASGGPADRSPGTVAPSGDRPSSSGTPSRSGAGEPRRAGTAGTTVPGTRDSGGASTPTPKPSRPSTSPPLPLPSGPARDTGADSAGARPPAAAEEPSRAEPEPPPPASGGSRQRALPAPHAELSTGMSLVFEVVPPDAFVLVDGTVIGRAAEYGARRGGRGYSLPGPGEHRVTLRRDGMEDYHIRLDASGSVGATTVRARMKPLAAAEIPFHELEMHRVREAIGLRVDPPNARVLVDDEPVGVARQFAGGRLGRGDWLELPLGMHRVSLIAVGRKRVDLAVDVTSGATDDRKRIDVVLPPLAGGGAP